MSKVKYIDKIFIINLEKDTEKLKHCEQLLQGYDYEITKAVEGKSLDYKLMNEFRIKLNLNPNLTACFMSHAKLWKRAIDENLERILIFEDDINVHYSIQDVFDKFTKYFDTIQDKPDLFYLGKCCDICSNMTHLVDNVYQLKSPLCLHAYILSREACQKLLDSLYNRSIVDTYIRKMIEDDKLTAQGFHPSLVYQDNMKFNTNLRSKKSSLGNYNECKDASTLSNCMIIILVIVILILIISFMLYIQNK